MAYRFRKRLTMGRCVLTVASVVLIFTFNRFIDPPQVNPRISHYDDDKQHIGYFSRRLLSLTNCTPPAIEQFPRDYFTQSQRHEGAFALHIVLAAYMFLALALVCDDYFVPSCERCCQVLKLQEDVAGATFMAAGSSAPELATAIIGVFIAKDDIGLGAVVGSAVFNIMFVISLCALFAGMVVYLNWWPLVRDCFFYTLSIIALVLVIMDEEVHWYEALVFLIMYAIYIIMMYFNRAIEAWIVPKFPGLGHNQRVVLKPIQGPSIDSDDGAGSNEEDEAVWDATVGQSCQERESLLNSALDGSEVNQMADNNNSSQSNNNGSVLNDKVDFAMFEVDEENNGESAVPWVWHIPKSWCRFFVWVLSLPLTAVMFVTVPDCRQTRWKGWFVVTFAMSIVWIGLYSYIMVWMITIVGHTLHIPDSVMGLTFIAAGSSVPDAITSLLVVRDGYGDMAVSNAVGSNVFDILLCLGLPWLLQTSLVDRTAPIPVYSAGLMYSSLTLLTTVVLLLVSTHCNGWRLTKPYGVYLLVIYILFNILSSLYELNFFGFVHPADCPSEY